MSLEGKRISELTEVSKVDTSSKLVIDTGGEEALSITLKNLIDSSGASSVDIATTEKAGIVKVGNNLTITEDGTLNANTDTLATKAELAGYLPLASKAVANGVASLDANAKVPTEQIPTATTSTIGGVKPDGDTITVTEDGTISAVGGSGSGDTIGLNIGDVVYSYSSSSSENPGKLPLFTGETIASANTIYPEFYNWVSSHPERVTTLNLYNQSIEQYGECPKYLIGDDTNNTVGWPFEKNKIIYTTNPNLTITIGSYNSSEGFSEAENYNLLYSNTSNISDSYVQVYIDEELTKPAYLKYVVTSGNTTTTTYRALFIKLFNSKITLYYSYNNDFSIVYDHTDTTVTGGVPLQLDIDSYISLSLESGSLRLPIIKNYIKAANPSEGIKNIEAGLPNITAKMMGATYGGLADAYVNASGACRTEGDGGAAAKGGTELYLWKHDFDASRSSAIYGKSSTVTPASTTLYPWVVAYTAAIPASTAQAAEFQQGLSGKADTSLSNLSAAGKDLASGLGMPSNRYIDLTLGASGSTYTAPANGYVCIFAMQTATSGWIHLYTPANKLYVFAQPPNVSGYSMSGFIPVLKGKTFVVGYADISLSSSGHFRFIYAEGAE